ncbi:Uncharacterised protein [Starkeya nomas]|uniref:SH3b domain-containing protein n=1 Tax=Starkeya nomas TaxID=2666134 RepID=A0A5S9NTS0_9HYPH|nr:SH3 domain-containing protein [Starkeya nomas]CAA0094027.1 Uncharacterised protein [Starkeya nomas]
MSSSSQEPRGTGLSSSLVSDFRAILNSLEQEKAARDDAAPLPSVRPAVSGPRPIPAVVAATPSPAADAPAAPAGSPVASVSSASARSAPGAPLRPAGETPAPRSYEEVRERLASLGDVSDMLAKRAPATPASKSDGAASADAGKPRRRGFGTSARATGEPEPKRKRSASTDVITWQRLGVLAVFMAVVGGGAVVLQSLAAREEASVAPEVIGNAAIASVAPSTAMPVAVAAVPSPEPAHAAATPEAGADRPADVAPTSVADALPPVLRDTAPPFDATATPPLAGVTAFAAPVAASGFQAADPAPADAAPAQAVAMPKEAPLPPRAPARPVLASTEPEPAAADTEEAADEAESQPGFGGQPVGGATIRTAVTMRAAPRNGAAAVGNLTAGQKVQLVACHGWCEVIAEGKRGFIYKRFVDAGTSARANKPGDADAATP